MATSSKTNDSLNDSFTTPMLEDSSSSDRDVFPSGDGPRFSSKSCVLMDRLGGVGGRLLNGFSASVGLESKTSPVPLKYRIDGLACRRTRSLAGPSPVCHFGPAAKLLEDHDHPDITTIHDPGSTRLNWHISPKSILVVKKVRDTEVLEPFVQLLQCLLLKEMTMYVEHPVLEEEQLLKNHVFEKMKNRLNPYSEGCEIDFIICLGGDGTLLYASSLFQASVPPVMAFHLGSLGFLTPFEFSNFEEKIDCVLSGHANLTLRSRLKCTINNKEHNSLLGNGIGEPSSAGSNKKDDHQKFLVLNDVVIDRGPSPYLVNLDLFMDGRMVTSVQGDGLIISTPTGSTAYAVAAGASIIHPGVPAIMITPICPHSLSFRPIVVPAGCDLRVMVSENARDSAWVSFDGRNRRQLGLGDCLKITTSVYPLPSVCAADQMSDWSNGLAGCLHWNVRKMQKPLSG